MRKQHMEDTPGWSVWLARLAVLAVFCINVTCAIQFIAWPAACAPAYDLPPTPESAAMVAGLGVAFLMWNVTYPPVIVNPIRHRVLYAVVLVQQLVGLVGESFILFTLDQAGLGAGGMAQGIVRFIAFDAGGLVVMLAGFVALQCAKRRPGRTRP